MDKIHVVLYIILAATVIESRSSTQFHAISKFIPEVLSNIKSKTNAYAHIDEQKIANYGCWCGKMAAGRTKFGGIPLDDFDYICRRWFQARHCLVLEGGTCTERIFSDNYSVTFNGGSIDESVEDHCYPTSLIENEPERKCMMSICRVDHMYVNLLLKKYVEYDIGSKETPTCERDMDIVRAIDSLNRCIVEDVYPFVKFAIGKREVRVRSRNRSVEKSVEKSANSRLKRKTVFKKTWNEWINRAI